MRSLHCQCHSLIGPALWRSIGIAETCLEDRIRVYCAVRHASMQTSKISFALLALHRGGRVVIDEAAVALGEMTAAQFNQDIFDGRRI
jgi:hypothetical protein